MKYLLDTNICIYIIKQKPKTVLDKFIDLDVFDVAVSSITLAELFYGVNKSNFKEKNLDALQEFLLPLEILYFDESDAFIYGKVRTELENMGKPIGSMDLLIASQALAKNLTLISNNISEFERIKELSLQNWV